MKKNKQKGQALITLIFFTVIAMIIITASVSVLFTNNLSATSNERGLTALSAAESGVEDGMVRLLHDLAFSGTYQPLGPLNDEEVVEITINSATSYTINSTGKVNNVTRKIQAQIVYNNIEGDPSFGKLSISSWKEL